MQLLPKNLSFKEDYIGLSLSKSAIRAITINPDKSIKAFAQVPLQPTVLDHGVLEKSALTQALQKLLREGKFSTSFAAVTIPDIYSFSRIHTLPKIPYDEVTEALTWQIENIFPLPKDQIYFDWKLINHQDSTLTVLVVALRRQLLDDILNIFQKLDLKPISFEPTASALTRVVQTDPNLPTILIEINPYGSSATLIENNLSSLTITNRFEKVSDSNITLQKTNQSVQELISFYKSKQNQPQVQIQALLTGESATKELASWLGNYLSLPVKTLEISNVPPAFHQPFAAAAASIFPPTSHQSINLLPPRIQATYDALLDHKKTLASAQLSVFSLIIAALISAATFIFTFTTLNQTNADLTIAKSQQSQNGSNLQQVPKINQISSSIVKLFPLKSTPVDQIQAALALAPRNLRITNLNYSKEKGSFTIIGLAQTRQDLLNFRDNLESSDNFIKINIPLGSLEKAINVDFAITASLANQ